MSPKKETPTITAPSAIPAAQYLRVSTERQEYSLQNQTQAISRYAEQNGFVIVQTYSDPAVSGILLRHRRGLQRLIQDVVQGQAAYKAILVYDVSRWGRFQDTDESAHYEFLCKHAGVPVHYCAEPFPNDDALSSMIMKAIKRVMAGEYVRELGEKVFRGQTRGATQGFRQGGAAGYALRRQLISADGRRKQILTTGERKSIATDRVILVRGPASEVRCVREIYRLFIKKRMTYAAIARELNRRKTKYVERSKWSVRAIQTILTHPKYIGSNVYGRYTQRLYTPLKAKARSEWTICPAAFEPLIDARTFQKAQEIIQRTQRFRPLDRSDRQLLNDLRSVLAKNGRITVELLKKYSKIPSAQTYRTRFGSLSDAYRLIGYRGFWRAGWLEARRRIQKLRNDLMNRILELNPTRVSVETRSGGYRSRLVFEEGPAVSISVCRPVYLGENKYWLFAPRGDECHLLTLVARLNPTFDAFEDMFLIPPLDRAKAVYLRKADSRLREGIKLRNLEQFWSAYCDISKRTSNS
jgi:DNA invertase Pin-like site-specific DNA recombinase